MYLDGEVDGRINPYIEGTGEVVAIGTGYSGRFFNGLIDEVAIFNVVLTQDDIKSIMAGGLLASSTAVSPSGKLATVWGVIKTR